MEKSVLAEPRHVHWASNLHSEYRSTYRWHEYRGEAAGQGAGGGAGPGVAQQPARQPPNALPLNRGPMEPAMPRRKKYPGVAYKTNELFEPAPPEPIAATAPSDRARSAERGDAGRAGRRSKSEGPRQPRWTDTVEPKATTALGEVLAAKEPEAASTEYRNQFAWPKDNADTPRKSISMGALKKAASGHDGSLETEPLMNNVEDHNEDHAPKKYIEDYLWNGQKPGVQRALPRDEKDSKESRNHSPKKFRSFKSAPHQSIHAKLQETKALERSPHKTSPQKQRKKLQGHSFDEGTVHEAAKAGEGKAEFKSPRRRPRSADPAPAHTKHLPNGHEPHPRPHKPSGLPLSSKSSRVRSSVSATRAAKSPSCPTKSPVAQRRSRSVSKVGIKLDDEPIPQRSASVAKEQYWDDSPVVKSPPEPTRVKSPEQLNVRSPDPVNWTVPLDTGKTFTVTQNVKSDEGVKRPSSEFKAGSAPDEQDAPHAAA